MDLLDIQILIINAKRELYNDGLKPNTEYFKYSWKKLVKHYIKKQKQNKGVKNEI